MKTDYLVNYIIRTFSLALMALTIIVAPLNSSMSQNPGTLKKGKSSGLPIPRFVSLKTDEVNVRNGPGKDHKVSWVYRKAGLPLEVIAEFENWRRVRDSEGIEGWVFHGLLSGRRTALIAPWNEKDKSNVPSHIPIYASKTEKKNNIKILLEPGILVHLIKCDGTWCNLGIKKHNGWIKQEQLWGVYKSEEL